MLSTSKHTACDRIMVSTAQFSEPKLLTRNGFQADMIILGRGIAIVLETVIEVEQDSKSVQVQYLGFLPDSQSLLAWLLCVTGCMADQTSTLDSWNQVDHLCL